MDGLEWLDPNKIVPYSQRNCIEFALNAKPVRRYIPKNPIQYKLWAFATSPACEYTVFAAIMLNTLSLAMKYYQQPKVKTIYCLFSAKKNLKKKNLKKDLEEGLSAEMVSAVKSSQGDPGSTESKYLLSIHLSIPNDSC